MSDIKEKIERAKSKMKMAGLATLISAASLTSCASNEGNNKDDVKEDKVEYVGAREDQVLVFDLDRDTVGMSLEYALGANRIDVVERMIKDGLDVNAPMPDTYNKPDRNKTREELRGLGWTEEKIEKEIEMLERFDEREVRARKNNKPIHYAETLEMVKFLEKNGADLNATNEDGRNLLEIVLYKSSDHNIDVDGIGKYLLEKGNKAEGITPYSYSAIKFCLENNVNFDREGALFNVVNVGKPETLELLLKSDGGKYVNSKISDNGLSVDGSITPLEDLMIGCSQNTFDDEWQKKVDLLVSYGANTKRAVEFAKKFGNEDTDFMIKVINNSVAKNLAKTNVKSR
ncbi:MAG: hypothetical protein IJZ30_00240 [Alphaproteobacteria bacterium]|nr:hypothetical protein [Alphaproteobacteria bacterium]